MRAASSHSASTLANKYYHPHWLNGWLRASADPT
jgi:ribosome modulation factor